VGDIKGNIEARNKGGEKGIADASGKLLSLAISLNSDLKVAGALTRGSRMQGVSWKSRRSTRSSGFRSGAACLAALFAVAFACIAQDGKPPATADTPSVQTADGNAHPIKDNNEHKKQIANESALLLDMALALKAEVDKTSKDTLSVDVIKKADQIERLAKTVKEKTKPGAGIEGGAPGH